MTLFQYSTLLESHQLESGLSSTFSSLDKKPAKGRKKEIKKLRHFFGCGRLC
jgi:hypothetical protein